MVSTELAVNFSEKSIDHCSSNVIRLTPQLYTPVTFNKISMALYLQGKCPRTVTTMLSLCVLSNRLQKISLQTVYTETSARLPHPGKRLDPDAAAAAFPDLCCGVAEKKLLWKHLLP